jgi:hypothetical protein
LWWYIWRFEGKLESVFVSTTIKSELQGETPIKNDVRAWMCWCDENLSQERYQVENYWRENHQNCTDMWHSCIVVQSYHFGMWITHRKHLFSSISSSALLMSLNGISCVTRSSTWISWEVTQQNVQCIIEIYAFQTICHKHTSYKLQSLSWPRFSSVSVNSEKCNFSLVKSAACTMLPSCNFLEKSVN